MLRLLAAGAGLKRYGSALAAVALTVAIRLSLEPLLQDDAAFLLFIAAVAFVAGIGGFGPGLLAAALSMIFVFTTATKIHDSSFLISSATFVAMGIGVSWARASATARAPCPIDREEPLVLIVCVNMARVLH